MASMINSCTSGSARFRTSWLRCSVRGYEPAWRTQSGCSWYRLDCGFTISGSTQIPKRRFSGDLATFKEVMAFTSGASPLGNRVGLGTQSPRPAESETRGYLSPNHPSSMTKSFTPKAADSCAMRCMFSSLMSKYNPSQLFSKTGRLSAANLLFIR